MNIAILINSLSGGGAERVAALVGDYYVGQGHNVYYFLGNYGLRQKYDVKGKVIKSDIRFGINRSGIRELLSDAGKVRKLKREYRIDVAISFMEEFNYLNILSKGKEKVIIRICRILSDSFYEMHSVFLKPWVLGLVYNRADRVVVMSDYAVDEMRRMYRIRKRRICKIANPVTAAGETAADEQEWNYGSKTVICVGRLADEKQINVAVKAFYAVCRKDKEIQFILLGEGYNRKKIQRMITGKGLEDRIHMLGFQKDVYFYLKHASVFVMTSRSEGFPNAMLEALNAGLPVVATDAPGGGAEILGKSRPDEKYCKYGILTLYVHDRDYHIDRITKEEAELGDTILELFDNDELYQTYHRQALKRAKRYQADRIMRQWDALLPDRTKRQERNYGGTDRDLGDRQGSGGDLL